MPNGRLAIVESHYPGRMRLRLPKERREKNALLEIKNVVSGFEGIRSVSTNPQTGSILVEYDPVAVDAERLAIISDAAHVIADMGELLKFGQQVSEWTEPSKSAQHVIAGMKKFNRSVSWMTRGTVDGKMAVALGLLILSLGRAFLGGQRSPAPWHSLLWYSYSLFMHWNRPLNE